MTQAIRVEVSGNNKKEPPSPLPASPIPNEQRTNNGGGLQWKSRTNNGGDAVEVMACHRSPDTRRFRSESSSSSACFPAGAFQSRVRTNMSPRLARCEPYLAQVSFSPAQVAQLPMHPSLLHHSPRHHKAARSQQAYCLTDPDIASAQHTANRSCVGSQLHHVNKCRCSTLAPRSAPEAPCTSRRRCRGQNRQARSKRL